MNVSLKRVYAPPAPGGGRHGDGMRILVDRLWPRGVRKADAHIDLWLRDIAPSPALRTWFGHDPEKWAEFQKKYRAELKEPPAQAALAELRALCRQGKVTLVFGARDEEHNHAVVLQRLLSHA
ncbi:MAG TPA: DUF488 domain-containing protein [Fibrobacteria bacterium]|nr:DUF488 domain-containing protein [Fibrobacteria bacterium]